MGALGASRSWWESWWESGESSRGGREWPGFNLREKRQSRRKGAIEGRDTGGWAPEKRQEGGMGRLAQRARNSEVEEGRRLERCRMEPRGGCIQMAGRPGSTVGPPSQALASVQIRSASRQHCGFQRLFPYPKVA